METIGISVKQPVRRNAKCIVIGGLPVFDGPLAGGDLVGLFRVPGLVLEGG